MNFNFENIFRYDVLQGGIFKSSGEPVKIIVELCSMTIKKIQKALKQSKPFYNLSHWKIAAFK